MKIISLKCNHCGADLSIDPNIKFFTCSFCASSLTIKASGNIMYTEVLHEIKENTETLIDHSELILLEKEIARLDRDWSHEREQYMIIDEKGVSHLPSSVNTYFRILACILVFILFAVFFSGSIPGFHSVKPDDPISLIMVILLGFLILAASIIYILLYDKNLRNFHSARSTYRAARSQLLLKIKQKKQEQS